MDDAITIEARVGRAVVKSLRAITAAEGFHTTPVVEADAEISPGGVAVVRITTDAATPAESVDAEQRAYDIVVSIDCRVSGPGGADGVRRVLDLVSDVRRRLAEDRSLDGSVLEIQELVGYPADAAIARGNGSARLAYRARVVTSAIDYVADGDTEETP